MAETAILERLKAFGFGENVDVDPTSLDIESARALFQRALKARNWEVFVPALFGRPIVAEIKNGRRRPKLWVLDGQHRVYEAIQAGIDTVPCVLYKGMTPENAAAMFDILNSDRKSLPAPDEFRAAVVSGNAAAVALNLALLERGLDGTCLLDGYKHLSVISTVRVLQDEITKHTDDAEAGLEHTLYTLDTIRAIWPWDGPDSIEKTPHTRAVRGFGQFLRPEKAREVQGSNKTAKEIARWDRKDTKLLIDHLRTRYGPQYGEKGLDDFLRLAQGKTPGGGGGGGTLGMQWALDDEFQAALRAAGRPPVQHERVTKKAKKAKA